MTILIRAELETDFDALTAKRLMFPDQKELTELAVNHVSLGYDCGVLLVAPRGMASEPNLSHSAVASL
jgi:hypothetical protein